MFHFIRRQIVTSIGVALVASGALAPQAHAEDVWRYGEVEAKGDAGILFMPEKFGEKYGITIKMVGFASGTTPVRALISGDLDVFTTTPSIGLVAMSHGAKLKFIACNWPGATYILYGAPKVKTMADLKGGSISVSGPGSMPDLFSRELLAKNGIADTDVTFANAGGGSDRFKALAAGVVSATATTSEFIPMAKKMGLNVLASAHDDLPNFMRNCLVTTDKVIQTRHDGLVKFLAAHISAQRYVLSHRAETIALAKTEAHLPDNDTTAAYIYDEVIQQKSVDPDMAVPADKIQWTEDLLARHKVIASSLKVADFIDDGPRQEALKAVKP